MTSAPQPPAATQGGASPKAFSRSTALVSVDGSTELLREVAATALAETPGLTARAVAAVRAGDARATQEAAHSLKGMLQCLGGRPAGACAFELEQAGRAGDMSRAPALLAALEQEVARFLAALRAAVA